MSNQNVRKGEELPVNILKEFLQNENLINSIQSELSVTQFTHGYSNLTYLLSIENKEFVLRKPPIGAIKRGHDMSREYKVQSKIQKGFSKVPKMYAYSNDASILGSEFYIMEKVEGIILNFKEAKKRSIQPTKFKTISNDLKEISKKSDPMKTIYLFHAPPYKTNLDRADLDDKIIDHVKLDVNIGSIAIKRFIKKYQPFLTLHGHVHESSRLTGKWSEKIRETYSFSAAYEGENLAIVYFDTENLSRAKRGII